MATMRMLALFIAIAAFATLSTVRGAQESLQLTPELHLATNTMAHLGRRLLGTTTSNGATRVTNNVISRVESFQDDLSTGGEEIEGKRKLLAGFSSDEDGQSASDVKAEIQDFIGEMKASGGKKLLAGFSSDEDGQSASDVKAEIQDFIGEMKASGGKKLLAGFSSDEDGQSATDVKAEIQDFIGEMKASGGKKLLAGFSSDDDGESAADIKAEVQNFISDMKASGGRKLLTGLCFGAACKKAEIETSAADVDGANASGA